MNLAGSGPPTSKWIPAHVRNEDNCLRLFCLPHAGAGITMFHSWKRDLPSFIEVCPILLPGREARLSEPLCTDSRELIEQMTWALTGYVNQPYAIFGHSMGALLAFELAQSLRAHGLREPSYLFLSGRNAPQLPLQQQAIHRLSTDQFLAELERRYGGLPSEIRSDPQMLEVYLPILRADLTLLETHVYREQRPLDCPAMAYAGVHDRNVSSEGLTAWGQLTAAPFTIRRFEGDHFYLSRRGRTPLLQLLADTLTPVHSATSRGLDPSEAEHVSQGELT